VEETHSKYNKYTSSKICRLSKHDLQSTIQEYDKLKKKSDGGSRVNVKPQL